MMGDLPHSWAEAKIADAVKAYQTADPTRSPDAAFRYVDIGAIDNSCQRITDPKNFKGKDAPSRARRVIASGDVLFSTVRTYLKNVAMVPEHLDGELTSTGICVLRASEACDPNYLFRWVSSTAFIREISQSQDGTLYPAVRDEDVLQGPIPLPPLPEQRRIVRNLDTLGARTTAARIHLTAIGNLVERYKLAVLRSAFAGNLTADFRDANALEPVSDLLARTPAPQQGRGGRQPTTDVIGGRGGISVNVPSVELPNDWEWVPLLLVARQETGHTPSRSRDDWWGGDVFWLSIPDANIHHGGVIHDTIQKTNEDGLANSSARLLPKGTVVLSRTASVGYICILGREMATSQDFATWTCSAALEPEYLMYALLSEGEDIKKFGEGSTHTTIYFPEIRAFHIKMAPLDEQREIVSRIEAAFKKIDRLAAEAGKALKLVGHLDQRILAKAFAGELVPQDPDDEAATTLLARIRAEREADPAPKRGRRKAST